MPARAPQRPSPATTVTRRAAAGDPAPPAPVAFASTRPLSSEELRGAPVRWPRPSRLQRQLDPAGKRIVSGLRALGLETVGELLEHLPTDSREARTVAGLAPGEQATVAVQVRSIAARPVRRRRMRPLVEAAVFDASGSMRATFFNQPWLVERYPPGTRLLLHGKPDGRGRFNVSHHAPAQTGIGDGGAGAAARRRVGRPLPGRRGRDLDPDPDARPGRARRALPTSSRSSRPKPGRPSVCPTARAPLPRCTSRATPATPASAGDGSPTRSCC